MKKLMIAACAVAIAAVAQAASVNWNSGDISSEGLECAGTKISQNQCVMCYIWEFTEAQWTGVYEASGAIWDAYQNGALTTSDANFISGRADAVFGYTEVGGKLAGVEEGDNVYAAVLFLHNDTGDFANPTYYMENWSAEEASDAGVDVGDLGNTIGGDGSVYSGAGGSTSWMAATAAPEPTSGLLLLLGVAGLALRRRRA